MIDIRDALYVPGFGFSCTKTKDQSLGSPEADFAALMVEARAAQAKRQAEEASKGAFTRAELTQEDIKELAAKYDPANMSQEEYDSFLDDLIEKGVLEEKDLDYIDYRGDRIPNGQFVCVGQVDFFADDPFDFKGAICGHTWTGPRGDVPFTSWRPSDADVLSWAKNMSLWKPFGNSSSYVARSMLDAENRRCDIFTVLADALDAMQRKRSLMF